jgi:hypothetical protein
LLYVNFQAFFFSLLNEVYEMSKIH